MNDLLAAIGLQGLKPLAGVLLMPPLPFLLLVLLGARLMAAKRLAGWACVVAGVAGVWLSTTTVTASALEHLLLGEQRPLSANALAELRRAPKTAIVVLGGGRRLLAPEYGTADLQPITWERLRYGIWLSRQTGLPLAFSGGVGHGSLPGPSEAEVAARVADRDFGRTLRWTEGRSRDTAENALRTLELLKPEGIERIVLVTHGLHMRRALGAFARASERTGIAMQVVAAPMALRAPGGPTRPIDWLPTTEGFAWTRYVLHEWLGRLAGA